LYLFSPIEIGLLGRPAPGVGLRRRDNSSYCLKKRVNPLRPCQSVSHLYLFSPIEIGLFGRPAPGVGLRRRDN